MTVARIIAGVAESVLGLVSVGDRCRCWGARGSGIRGLHGSVDVVERGRWVCGGHIHGDCSTRFGFEHEGARVDVAAEAARGQSRPTVQVHGVASPRRK